MPSSSRKSPSKSPLKPPPKVGTGNKGGASSKYQKFGCFGEDGTVYCFCDFDPRLEAVLKTARNGRAENVGRQFWSCDNPADQCRFFLWADESEQNGGPPPPNALSDDDFPGRGRSLGVGNANKTPSPNKNKDKKRGRAHDLSDCDDEVYGEWEDASHLFRRDRSESPPSPSASRGKTGASSSSSSQQKNKKRRARRSPSPDWPDADELQASIEEKEREISRLKRQVQEAERVAEGARKEREEVKEENVALLEKLYPGLFENSQKAA